MITPQLVAITLAAGAGGGVTSNKQVSSSRLNTRKVTFSCPASNAGTTRVGQAVWTNPGPGNTEGSFAAPTSPLTDITAIALIIPGASRTFEVTVHDGSYGHNYDLQRFYLQGTLNDVIQVTYDLRIDA